MEFGLSSTEESLHPKIRILLQPGQYELVLGAVEGPETRTVQVIVDKETLLDLR